MPRLSRRKQSELQAQGYDLPFISQIQPQGNIDLTPDRYWVSGDGYHTVLHVTDFPSAGLAQFWLSDLMLIEGTRAFLSVKRENNSDLSKQVSRSIEEKSSRISEYAKATQNFEELNEIQDLTSFFNGISKQNLATCGIYVRIFLSASTEKALFDKVDEVKDKTLAFDLTILLGEQDFELKAPFVPTSKHIELPNRRRAQPVPANILSKGYFFNHTKLDDPNGTYFGYTSTSGAINFDFLHRDERRTRSFMIVAGQQGMNHRNFVLRQTDSLYAKGHFIRNFDADGSFLELTGHQHGLILDLAGEENRINPFQIFPTATLADGVTVDEERSFKLHVSKLKTIFKLLNDDVTGDDLTRFSSILKDFYIEEGLWFKNPSLHRDELIATQIVKEEYPVLSDFVNYLYDVERIESSLKNPNTSRLESIERIKDTFSDLLQEHAATFEGTTEFQDISSEQVVTFSFQSLKGDAAIYNAQTFSVLSMLSADIVNNGKRCRQLLKADPNKEISDLPHYVVNISGANHIIDPKYAQSVTLLADIISEMGDNFAGVVLSVNSLQGILFESTAGSHADPYMIAVKKIFGLMQYRLFGQQDETSVSLLANALVGSMTKSELETLPRMLKGQLFMNIAGVGNRVFTQELLKEDLERYGHIE